MEWETKNSILTFEEYEKQLNIPVVIKRYLLWI